MSWTNEQARRDLWNCSICTFKNHPDLSYCEMCSSPKSMEHRVDTCINNRQNRPNINVTHNTLYFDEEKKDDDDEIYNGITTNKDTTPTQLRQIAPRPTSCNGDCGSELSKMISYIINPKVQ